MDTLGQVKLRASASRAFKRGLREVWDSLGFVVAASLAVSIGCVGFAAFSLALARNFRLGTVEALLFLPILLFGWVALAGVFRYAWMLATGKHPDINDVFVAVRQLFWPSVKLFVIDLAITAVLLGDAVFFLSVKCCFILQMLGVLMCYLGVVWLMMAMYHLPLLAAQLDMDSGPRPAVIMRKSYLLMADNPSFTLATLLAIIAFAVACGVTVVGVVTVLPGAAAFLLTHCLRELFIKYGIIEEEPENLSDDWPGIT